MLEKIKCLIGSIRFWAITFGWLAVYLGVVGQHGFNLVELFNQLAIWMGSIAAVGTIDKFSEK